jgi:hypothetical protein
MLAAPVVYITGPVAVGINDYQQHLIVEAVHNLIAGIKHNFLKTFESILLGATDQPPLLGEVVAEGPESNTDICILGIY